MKRVSSEAPTSPRKRHGGAFVHQARKHPRIVRVLVDAGIGPSPDLLRHFACVGDAEMVDFLLRWGVDANRLNPLSSAAARGHIGVVDRLILSGADATRENSQALVSASTLGHASCVEALLRAGANPLKRSSECIAQAARNRHFRIVHMLADAAQTVMAQRPTRRRKAVRSVKSARNGQFPV